MPEKTRSQTTQGQEEATSINMEARLVVIEQLVGKLTMEVETL